MNAHDHTSNMRPYRTIPATEIQTGMEIRVRDLTFVVEAVTQHGPDHLALHAQRGGVVVRAAAAITVLESVETPAYKVGDPLRYTGEVPAADVPGWMRALMSYRRPVGQGAHEVFTSSGSQILHDGQFVRAEAVQA